MNTTMNESIRDAVYDYAVSQILESLEGCDAAQTARELREGIRAGWSAAMLDSGVPEELQAELRFSIIEDDANDLIAAPELLKAGIGVIEAWESGNLAAAVRLLSSAIDKATRSPRCTCDTPCTGPVPNYCPDHDGDYSAFLAANNCD